MRPMESGRSMSYRHFHYSEQTIGDVELSRATSGVSMKGIVILSLCAVYTIVLFSCVAVIKALAVLLMGQPLAIKAIDFNKKQQKLEDYDPDFIFGDAPCSRCSSISGRN